MLLFSVYNIERGVAIYLSTKRRGCGNHRLRHLRHLTLHSQQIHLHTMGHTPAEILLQRRCRRRRRRSISTRNTSCHQANHRKRRQTSSTKRRPHMSKTQRERLRHPTSHSRKIPRPTRHTRCPPPPHISITPKNHNQPKTTTPPTP